MVVFVFGEKGKKTISITYNEWPSTRDAVRAVKQGPLCGLFLPL